MNFEFLTRIFALLAAANAIIWVTAEQFTNLAVDFPQLAAASLVLFKISAIITPFLPRAIKGILTSGT